MGQGMIELKNLIKDYETGEVLVKALKDVSFDIQKGEFIAVMGPSGSGKSTLLHILGLLDKQTKGQYFINGLNISELPEEKKCYYRLTQFGYVFQEYALISELTALENVYLPLIMNGIKKSDANKIAHSALKIVGLNGKEKRMENQLSGGERQRVAIARAIVSNPKILFADEPCANLDSKTSEQILEVFKFLNKRFGLTIIMVTHEDWHTKYASRIIRLKDGIVVSDNKK
ncbi:MAG: ABC transporter ATP-binding protein [Nanoarchaeota archaeon]